MKIIRFYLLAFTGGIFLAIQAGYNSQLGAITKQPVLAVVATALVSAFLGGIYLFVNKETIQILQLNLIPSYLWFLGGIFSLLGLLLYFYTIPKLGISTMITFGLCGQLFFSVIASHFGWFNFPKDPISIKKIGGISSMIIGIYLINTK